MKKTRILSLLLALSIVMTALTLTVGAAGVNPTLKIKNPGTSAQTLSLRSLPADCCGIQLTLELDRHLDHAAFVFADSLPAASAYYTYQEGVSGEQNVTLYLTTKAAFAQGELVLGTLFGNESFQIVSVSYLELLIGSGGNLESVICESVALEKPEQGSSGNSGPINSGPIRYTISVPEFANGSVTLNPTTAAAGSIVTVTVQPDAGYQLQELTVTSRSGAEVIVTDKGGGVFTFVMPSSPVELQASFVPTPAEVPDPVVLPFTDVKSGEWYYDAVEYVYTHGLMTGTSKTAFSPDVISSRGMIVTILYRLEGEPGADVSFFDDVEPGEWYTDAVNWCAANDVVKGVGDGRFAPNDTITREQMATILYRYAEYKSYDVTARADLSTFADAEMVSPYALESMQWAVAEKLIQGMSSIETGTTLSPFGSAVRSQSAAILMRFCENIAEG